MSIFKDAGSEVKRVSNGVMSNGCELEKFKLTETSKVDTETRTKETQETNCDSTSGERHLSRQFSQSDALGAETTTNQMENDDSDMSKSKSDASVQTDLVIHKSQKVLKKRYSNIFATNLITKISIWVSKTKRFSQFFSHSFILKVSITFALFLSSRWSFGCRFCHFCWASSN